MTDYFHFFMAQQPLGSRAFSASRLHDHTNLDTSQWVGLLWTSDKPNAGTSTWQHTTLTRDGHLYTRRNSNPHSQQTSDSRPSP